MFERASSASSVRVRQPVAASARLTYFFTVSSVSESRRPIEALVKPVATNSATSRCRLDSRPSR